MPGDRSPLCCVNGLVNNLETALHELERCCCTSADRLDLVVAPDGGRHSAPVGEVVEVLTPWVVLGALQFSPGDGQW
jgi:hypothetical protein